jgi:pyridinium-3,5-bisthiocarboxylic acid mononucleotide nickel chelatase
VGWQEQKKTLEIKKHRATPDVSLFQEFQSIETIAVLETQVDDMTAQAIAYTMEQLLQNGALDVYTQAIGMKKSRNGILITVICPCDRQNICEQILFQETSTLGIRYRLQERKILYREIHEVETEYGKARVKMAWRGGFWTIQPEYEDCAKLARSQNIPLTQVQEAVKIAGEQIEFLW